MQPHDWSRFTLRVPINSTKQTVYDAWSTQQGLESWFLRQASFTTAAGEPRSPSEKLQIADSYIWMWHGWSDEVTEKGVVLQENGEDLFKFSFGNAGNVTVTILEDEGQLVVELLQDEIPTDEHSMILYHIGCTKGWLFYLTNLKSILEGGIDMRNRNEALKDVINS